MIARITTIFVMISALAAGQAFAEDVRDFYRGRTVEFIVGTGPGGGYDLYARLLSRHLGKHIPGNPKIVVTNVPGAGGIRAANLLYNVSPRDGSVIGTFSNALITQPIIGTDAAKFDPNKFTWLGSLAREDGVCVAWKTAGVKDWNELQKKELVAGTMAPGATTYVYPVLLQKLMGAKFRLVTGYPDSPAAILALEKGEINSICQTYSSLAALHPDWFANGDVIPLVTLALKRNPALPDVPAVAEFAVSDEQRQMLRIVLTPTLAGRPVLAPPELPKDRAYALRQAFEETLMDTEFVDEARRLKLEINPATGSEVQDLISEIYAIPNTTLHRARALFAN